MSVLCCFPDEKLNILFENLLPCTHRIVYLKCIGSGIQTTVKPNKVSSIKSWHTCYNLLKVLSIKLLGHG